MKTPPAEKLRKTRASSAKKKQVISKPIIVPASFVTSLFTQAEEMFLSHMKPTARKRIVDQMSVLQTSNLVPIRIRVLQSKLPNKSEVLQRLVGDHGKYESWVNNLLKIPFEKVTPPPVRDDIGFYLRETQYRMDEYVYGQFEAKDEILRILCQWCNGGGLNTFAIALEGGAGIGKTTFAKNVISRVMSRPFHFISLGGISDASHLVGHSFTYEGAIPGRIAQCLMTSDVMNPCFYFDELDKVSKSLKGDEIYNVLMHLTDREQNDAFQDKYFHGLHFDLSQSICIFSYNDHREVPPILLDRLKVIRMKSPSVEEKMHIARQHLLPKILKSHGISSFSLHDEVLMHVIDKHTDEAGVRGLDKALHKIVSTITVMQYAGDVLRTRKFEGNLLDCDAVDTLLGQKCGNHQPFLNMYM